ncbi:MAG: 50S ribosomal protein L13 [Proteobacteria bacterium]|nr:MAG: 50S ribosomal protein L13 [Pseudomonadota bacterium]
MYTQSFNSETIERAWHVVDLEGQTLGRVASRIAQVLRGKHRPEYTPHADCGDFVVVVNADKVHLTGNKLRDKSYYKHTGYMGGLKSKTAAQLLETHPERVIAKAVKGMLPRGPLGRRMFKKLKIYAGPDHPHAAQKPQPLDLSR